MVVNSPMLEIARDCFKDLRIYSPPYMVERLMAVNGCHLANLANMLSLQHKSGGIRKHGRPLNIRQHCALVIPSGFGKSTYIRTFYEHISGLMYSKLCPTSVRSTFSRESWLGTHIKDDTDLKVSNGIFTRFKSGIVGADEYARLLCLMSGDGIEHDEVYLLTALDTDRAAKDLSTGAIEIDNIATTIVCGMRIPHEPVRMTSGLSRRFTFEMMLPGPYEALMIKTINRNWTPPTYKMEQYQQDMCAEINAFMKQYINGFPTNLDFSEIEGWCDDKDIPHFQEDLYKRMSVGFSVATGEFPTIHLTHELSDLFLNEIHTREELKTNVLGEIARQVILSHHNLNHETVSVKLPGKKNIEKFPSMPEKKLERFMMKYYQLPRAKTREAVSLARRWKGLRKETKKGVSNLFLIE